MRTTLIIDDSMLKKASELTGIKEKTSLVRLDSKRSFPEKAANDLRRWAAQIKIYCP
jgi:hypothetical protein